MERMLLQRLRRLATWTVTNERLGDFILYKRAHARALVVADNTRRLLAGKWQMRETIASAKSAIFLLSFHMSL